MGRTAQVEFMYQQCAAAAAAKSLQSCPTLCDPTDGSPPGSPVPGILQARTRKWVAISFSNAWKWKVKVKSLSRVRPSATPWTIAHQASPSMRFSRQEYWRGLPLPSPTSSVKSTNYFDPHLCWQAQEKKGELGNQSFGTGNRKLGNFVIWSQLQESKGNT